MRDNADKDSNSERDRPRSRDRITTVTTRGGDQGTTRLADGQEIQKTSPVIDALGSVDELNSFVGLLVTHLSALHEADEPTGGDKSRHICEFCVELQQNLFDLGAHIALSGATAAPAPDPVEREAAELNAQLPPLREFVLPGGSRGAALAHVCRSVCRRAERDLWRAADQADALSHAARYLNRLSDYFFVVARTLNAGSKEPQWRGLQSKPPTVG